MDSRLDHALLYDDDCGFCKLCVRGILRLDREERLRPVAIQSEEGQRLLTEIPGPLRLESAHLVTPGGTVLSGGAAAPTLARLLPGGRIPARAFARWPERTDASYRWVARNRSRFGRIGLRSRAPIEPRRGQELD
ncbi:MAG: DUF393 domain-containing protein [Thermoleophilales bacterium]|nr:DUF393 domain-containing protein [Thermoleophilales bacterium]